MRNRCHISNQRNFQSCSLQCPNCGFSTCSGTTHHYFNLSHPLIGCSTSRVFRCCLGSKRCSLLRTFEATRTRRCPRNHFTIGVRDRDNRVVKRRLDVSNAIRNILLLLTRSSFSCWLSRHVQPFIPSSTPVFPRSRLAQLAKSPCQPLPLPLPASKHTAANSIYFLLGAFFLPATVRRPPRRVRAFVRVLCPRTGRPKRCRLPR